MINYICQHIIKNAYQCCSYMYKFKLIKKKIKRLKYKRKDKSILAIIF